MKLPILFWGLFLFGGAAWASVDVTCIDGDCLVYGWDVTDMKSGERSAVECTNLDCATEGWLTVYKDQAQVEIVCKAPGCFAAGWRVFDVRTGGALAETSCLRSFNGNSDCLSYGWETLDRRYGRSTTLCLRGDCLTWGWETQAPGYPVQRSLCKQGGCFQAGWTVRP